MTQSARDEPAEPTGPDEQELGRVVAFLEQGGYRVAFRFNVWWEVCASRDTEVWDGKGPTKVAALARALERLCPSHLGRLLLLESLALPAGELSRLLGGEALRSTVDP